MQRKVFKVSTLYKVDSREIFLEVCMKICVIFAMYLQRIWVIAGECEGCGNGIDFVVI